MLFRSVTAFVNHVATLVRDHKDAASNIHNEECCIEKLNATLQEHKDMAAHIQTLETQDSVLARRLGGGMPPRTYEGQLHELTQHAIVLRRHDDEVLRTT